MSPASLAVSSASCRCRAARSSSPALPSVPASMSRWRPIVLASLAKNCLTSWFDVASRRSSSPAASMPWRDRSCSMSPCWLAPACRNCPCSSWRTTASSRSDTCHSRDSAHTRRSSAARRGSVASKRSARRRNARSSSRYCETSSSSRVASGCAGASAAGWARAAPQAHPHATKAAAAGPRRPREPQRIDVRCIDRSTRLMDAAEARGRDASAPRGFPPESVPADGSRPAGARPAGCTTPTRSS